MLYPLKFKPVYKDYIWGGRGLERLNKELPQGKIAESWEISNHPDGEVIIANGEYAGISFTDFLEKQGQAIIGNTLTKEYIKKFPLLVKFIDANDNLSVQVHPRDEYAQINENGEKGKNEMWYVISAEPGAKIVYGVTPGTTKEVFYSAVKEDNIDSCLNFMEVVAGDAVNIPAGLLHALGKGIMVVEIQQNSNITYRVYDYKRTDKLGKRRPLHIEKAMEVIDFNNCDTNGKLKGVNIKLGEKSKKEILVSNEYFTVEDYFVDGTINENADGSRFLIYVCLQGEGKINYKEGAVESFVKISKGESILIPAVMGEFSIEGKLQLIKAFL